MEPVNVAVIYYSATGSVHALAQAAAEGAQKAGATVRLRKVRELAPPEAINSNPAWAQHIQDSADITEAALEDLAWADAVLLGTPTRFGNPASQLRAFLETTGPLWAQGRLAGKVCSAFAASNTAHGGQESTILALSNTFYHWGGIIVPPATPTRSSSRPAIRTGLRTSPPWAHPARTPWSRPVTRPGASSRRRRRSRPAARPPEQRPDRPATARRRPRARRPGPPSHPPPSHRRRHTPNSQGELS